MVRYLCVLSDLIFSIPFFECLKVSVKNCNNLGKNRLISFSFSKVSSQYNTEIKPNRITAVTPLKFKTIGKGEVCFLGSNFGTKFCAVNDFCFSFPQCHNVKETHHID